MRVQQNKNYRKLKNKLLDIGLYHVKFIHPSSIGGNHNFFEFKDGTNLNITINNTFKNNFNLVPSNCYIIEVGVLNLEENTVKIRYNTTKDNREDCDTWFAPAGMKRGTISLFMSGTNINKVHYNIRGRS